MPDIRSKEFNDNEYLLDFTADELNALAATELGSQINDDDIVVPTFKNKSIRKRIMTEKEINTNHEGTPPPPLPSSAFYMYKTTHREKQVVYKVPETKSKEAILLGDDGTPNEYLFSCDTTCNQHISYKLLSSTTNHHTECKPFDLDKLDIVLNAESTLEVQIDCILNGLDTLNHPLWIKESLDRIMQKSEFKNISTQQGGLFRYVIQKAFVTTPLSYLLEKQAPHGVLDKLYVILNWSTSNSKEFQSAWRSDGGGFKKQCISTYVEDALLELISRRVHSSYPLIFSTTFVKEITPVISHLPHISQSLLKIIKTSKATSPNIEFNERMLEKLKLIENNTSIMTPPLSNSNSRAEKEHDRDTTISTNLTLGLYYSVKKIHRYQQRFPASKTAVSFATPPDAREAITSIWSVTCSSASPTLTE